MQRFLLVFLSENRTRQLSAGCNVFAVGNRQEVEGIVLRRPLQELVEVLHVERRARKGVAGHILEFVPQTVGQRSLVVGHEFGLVLANGLRVVPPH